MLKRFMCFAIFFFLLSEVQSQLSMSVHEPPSGLVQKNQLWNITLIWSSNTSINVKISLSLLDVKENQPVLRAMTRTFLLVNGINQLKASDVEPVDYNYLSPAFDLNSMPQSLLPVGSYRACYTVYSDDKISEGALLSEDCFNFQVDPLSPPQLSLPADSSSLETPYPQFNWLPPAPIILFNDLNYDLLVTEVQEGQTAPEAIQENLPIYSAFRISAPFNNYASSNKSLDTGKLYAWRIIAKNGDAFIAQSEVWTFRIASKDSVRVSPIIGTYLELKNDGVPVNTDVITGKILGFKFYSYDSSHNGIIRFTDSKGKLTKEIKRVIQYGNNFLVIDLGNSFKPDETYSIQIEDLQHSLYKGAFRISK
ncbi:MAG: hypothetical protein JST13_04595 [Bacteroidetes bacterium]|nr:hypothetical protein [Bacteroidota bacterium]